MLHTDPAGVDITVPTPAAGAAWDALVDGLLFFAVDFPTRLDAAAAHDIAVAHALRAWLLHQAHDPRFDDAVTRSLETATRLAPDATTRERAHVDAVHASIRGGTSGAWDALVTEHPRDIVAVRSGYFDHYERGDTDGTLAIAERARPAWSAEDDWYPVVLGLAAFAHGESGDEVLAERLGREATERAPRDLWSVHSVAHALEETHRPAEGTRWIADHAHHLAPDVGFARHLWWHDALFLLALDDIDGVLARYDQFVASPASENHLDLTNRASLLARLERRGADVGDRWDELRELTARRITDHRSLFVHAHLALVEASSTAGDPDAFLRTTEEWATTDPLARDLGLPLVTAALGTASHDSSAAARDLLPRLGGSHAQREVFRPLFEA